MQQGMTSNTMSSMSWHASRSTTGRFQHTTCQRMRSTCSSQHCSSKVFHGLLVSEPGRQWTGIRTCPAQLQATEQDVCQNASLLTICLCRHQKMLRVVVREDHSYEMASALVKDMTSVIEWLDHHFIYDGERSLCGYTNPCICSCIAASYASMGCLCFACH